MDAYGRQQGPSEYPQYGEYEQAQQQQPFLPQQQQPLYNDAQRQPPSQYLPQQQANNGFGGQQQQPYAPASPVSPSQPQQQMYAPASSPARQQQPPPFSPPQYTQSELSPLRAPPPQQPHHVLQQPQQYTGAQGKYPQQPQPPAGPPPRQAMEAPALRSSMDGPTPLRRNESGLSRHSRASGGRPLDSERYRMQGTIQEAPSSQGHGAMYDAHDAQQRRDEQRYDSHAHDGVRPSRGHDAVRDSYSDSPRHPQSSHQHSPSKRRGDARRRGGSPSLGQSASSRSVSPSGVRRQGSRSSSPSRSASDYSDSFDNDSHQGSLGRRGGVHSSSGTLTATMADTSGTTMHSSVSYTDDTASRDVSGPPAGFHGDVSKWGRKQDPAMYSDVSDTTYTLSSGLSPRDTLPREKEFDVRAAKRTLAYTAGQYARAQALRRDGLSPHHVGITEDLPNRFAYEQLNQLAGMASKVQSAIEHNKAIFERRLRMEDHVLKNKVFDGWRALKMGTLAQQQILRRAIARLARSALFRAFDKWRNVFHLVDKNFAMRRKLTRTIQRGVMKRCFGAWRTLCHDRHLERLIELREAHIRSLELQITGFLKRPIQVLRHRKLYAIMQSWGGLSAHRAVKRLRLQKAISHMCKGQYLKAWNSWRDFIEVQTRRRNLLQKAAGCMRNLKIRSAWNSWLDLVESQRMKKQVENRVLRHWKNQAIAKSWNGWVSFVQWRKEKKKIALRWMQPLKAKAFYAWLENAACQKRNRLILHRAANKLRFGELATAWYTWVTWLEDEKLGRHMETKEQLAVRVEDLGAENERLRRDNERFVRLIDSGEWGRGRVAELVAAGEILKGERDALLKLIQSLRREYENVQNAKGNQEDELRSLKERMMLGGAARNRMLVKGGSSFNALVRAMKQDLVTGGPAGAPPAARDPNLLYAVDKLSMDRVTVFPDGELNVQALASVPGSATFARPVSTGRGPDRRAPVQPYNVRQQPARTPQGLVYLGQDAGGQAGAPRTPGRGPALAPGRPAPGVGGMAAGPTQRVLDALQSLTPREIDRLEGALREERSRAGDVGSMAASAPGRH